MFVVIAIKNVFLSIYFLEMIRLKPFSSQILYPNHWSFTKNTYHSQLWFLQSILQFQDMCLLIAFVHVVPSELCTCPFPSISIYSSIISIYFFHPFIFISIHFHFHPFSFLSIFISINFYFHWFSIPSIFIAIHFHSHFHFI